MTTPAISPAIPPAAVVSARVQELVDRHDIADALLRFAEGQDRDDPDLFLSAFAADATLDFTQPARRFGADVPVMPDRATIAGILGTLAPLDTTHTVTNVRIVLDRDRARLTALVEAQHVTKAEPRRHLLLKNTYDVELSRDADRWVIDRMVIRTVWHDGDPSVLFGAAADGIAEPPGPHASTTAPT